MPILGFTFRYTNFNNIFYPLIPIKFRLGGTVTTEIDGVLDTGSDYILINKGTAEYLGLQLDGWITTGRAAVSTFNYCRRRVDLIIGRDGRVQEFNDIEINVTDNRNEPVLPLIGRYPLFDFYNVFFDNKQNKFKLIPK